MYLIVMLTNGRSPDGAGDQWAPTSRCCRPRHLHLSVFMLIEVFRMTDKSELKELFRWGVKGYLDSPKLICMNINSIFALLITVLESMYKI